jgi:hypothetical protein
MLYWSAKENEEEKLLAERPGAEYQAYMRRLPRMNLVPGIIRLRRDHRRSQSRQECQRCCRTARRAGRQVRYPQVSHNRDTVEGLLPMGPRQAGNPRGYQMIALQFGGQRTCLAPGFESRPSSPQVSARLVLQRIHDGSVTRRTTRGLMRGLDRRRP